MERRTFKDENGNWCIDGKNGRLTGDRMGRFYGPDVDALAAYEDTQEQGQVMLPGKPKGEPLTLDELWQKDEEPVWVCFLDHPDYPQYGSKNWRNDGWRIYKRERAGEAKLIGYPCGNIKYENEYGKTWLAYAHKPDKQVREETQRPKKQKPHDGGSRHEARLSPVLNHQDAASL